jgi:exodeoxyribonuclease VII large subunit
MNQMDLILSPADFVAITNQALEYTFGVVKIKGEVANFRVSKNRWVYFDIKDEFAKVSCFSSVHILPGPIEDGMLVLISGQAKLHPEFGFSINLVSLQPAGEGSIKKAFELLKAKLQLDGIFDESRKRNLVYPPQNIALVTSLESAAYADFIKIINQRWPYLTIEVHDVMVQGELAANQIVSALNVINNSAILPEVIVITRGGGSRDDLVVYDDERVVRAIASSRVVTLLAIGHEIDTSLSELAADKRASTPSNAAELLVPDKNAELKNLKHIANSLNNGLLSTVRLNKMNILTAKGNLIYMLQLKLRAAKDQLQSARALIKVYNPNSVLQRGYAIVRHKSATLTSVSSVKLGDNLQITLYDGNLDAAVKSIRAKKEQ